MLSSTWPAPDFSGIVPLIKTRDAVVVADPDGKTLFSVNADQPLIPASILKILTSLAAFHYLGNDFRFITEFYIDDRANLTVKGYGDPLIISEVLTQIAGSVAGILQSTPAYCRNNRSINHLFLDDTYFLHSLKTPGVKASIEPYDSPNSALCVNFNTVRFKRRGTTYVSAEPQTPLLPMVLPRIKKSKLMNGRILLSQNRQESTRYAGHLLAHFLRQQGIKIKGDIKTGSIEKKKDRLLFRYVSHFSLPRIISRLLEYSNNFIANQLLITIGIKAGSAPGSLARGSCAVMDYAINNLGVTRLTMVEGSGISRKNKLSATDMIRILQNFMPYRHLMQRNGNIIYKTGTLTGISTRAGYYEGKDGQVYLFVVMVNTPPARSAGDIVNAVRKCIEDSDLRHR
ncbi:MAG: D-alanyl-D-alanine carboxypeptidase [Deltaproteobacteria bacterium]|nr:D-alanyl-D-alanine carboxypeptidase [Deltaproteobacteria bacterium]